MTTPEEKKILENIEKTGYPLEIDVSTWLIEDGWKAYPEWSYFDKQTGAMRAIDIVADYVLKGFEEYVTPLLLVECKTSKNPWVFYSIYAYSDEKKVVGWDDLRQTAMGHEVNHLLQLDGKAVSYSLDDMVQLFKNVHLFSSRLPHSFSCHVVREKARENEPDDFHRAILELRGAYLDLERFPGKPIFMVIVLRGKMFELWRRQGVSKLIPRSHVMFQTLAMMSEETRLYPPTIVDVVTDTYFQDYLKIIKEDFKVLRTMYDRLYKKRRGKQR